ncbi:flagellar basal body-associated protein FliL [Desulfovibrio sp. DV]|uniref:flagellar basal body-associated FliL family protein n=1 Tax=Desulfovibrio sp. DV TaxID=1844708 RepID=UPI00094BA15A|nr:flagellar basal body-associated FliL family protein [Desulfovibrio sp. DV]
MGRVVWMAAVLWLAILAVPAGGLAQGEPVVRGGAVTYPGFDVNIDDGGRLGRLHVAFEVLFTDEQGAKLAATPQVKETLLLFLREKTAAELLAPKGRDTLRRELLAQINGAIGGPRAIRLFFMDYLVIKAGTP